MNAGTIVRTARTRARLSLRELARRANTSHSTIAAYEAGRKIPTIDTLDRIVRATGHDLELSGRLKAFSGPEREAELLEVLELAAAFPAAPPAKLDYPLFGR